MRAARDRPKVERLLRSTFRNRRDLWAWDVLAAGALTLAAVALIDTPTLNRALGPLLIAETAVVGALLGVVIAGFAIIAAFLSPEMVNVLQRTRTGIEGEFWPFWYVAALATWAIVVSSGGFVLQTQCPGSRMWVFAISTFLTSYALFAALNLVGFIAAQAANRARLILSSRDEDEA